MLSTEFIHGQGLGNQLFCYVTTRMLAHKLGYDFGIGGLRNAGDSRVNKKGFYFMNLDYGKEVSGTLTRYDEYRHALWTDSQLKTDIRLTDKKLLSISDNTIIYGNLQSEEYFGDRIDLIKGWLKVNEEYEHMDTNGKNVCVMNFRGGDIIGNSGAWLPRSYWINAIDNMIQYNPNMEFCIVTDDVKAANAMLPEYTAYHDEIAWDYVAIKNARNVICSVSTFACFPLWTSETLEYCISPKYCNDFNNSQGWWSLGYAIHSYPTYYQDRQGNLFTPEQCRVEWEEYKKTSKIYEGDL
jgi:hypothetical protein